MKYLLTIHENKKKEAKALLNFILISNVFDITEISEKIPNEETIKAINEVKQDDLKRFNNVSDLMKELNA